MSALASFVKILPFLTHLLLEITHVDVTNFVHRDDTCQFQHVSFCSEQSMCRYKGARTHTCKHTNTHAHTYKHTSKHVHEHMHAHILSLSLSLRFGVPPGCPRRNGSPASRGDTCTHAHTNICTHKHTYHYHLLNMQ